MTEATHQASTVLPLDNEAARLNTVGKPTGSSVRIVDDNGKTCPIGVTGEIWLSGPTVVRGYLNNSAATAATLSTVGCERATSVLSTATELSAYGGGSRS
jgi:long-subunit acyl-CoA synthetase (AMP-forming)